MWHLTPDMWHVTHGGGGKFSKNFSYLALTVWDLWYLEDWEEKARKVPRKYSESTREVLGKYRESTQRSLEEYTSKSTWQELVLGLELQLGYSLILPVDSLQYCAKPSKCSWIHWSIVHCSPVQCNGGQWSWGCVLYTVYSIQCVRYTAVLPPLSRCLGFQRPGQGQNGKTTKLQEPVHCCLAQMSINSRKN